VVKVIWQKTVSPPHTDSLIVFARWRQCAPHLSNVCFFGPTRVHNPNGISIGSAIFAQLTVAHLAAPSPFKLVPSYRYLDVHLTWFPGPTQVHSEQYLDRFSRCCTAHDRDRQTDRQTTLRPTPSLTVGHIYIRGTATRLNHKVHRNICMAHNKTAAWDALVQAGKHYAIRLWSATVATRGAGGGRPPAENSGRLHRIQVVSLAFSSLQQFS